QVDDPDLEDSVSLTWHAYLCTDATDIGTCDLDPGFYTSTNASAAFVVPITRADGVTQVTSVLVLLAAVDDGGAMARPEQKTIIPIGERPPDVELRKIGRNGYVVGTPIDLFAKYSDLDDTIDQVTVDWQIVSPQVDSTFTLVDLPPDLTDPLHPV